MFSTAFCLLAVLFLVTVRSIISEKGATYQLQFLESLDNARLNWLRDFVRRGKGSVSRLPFEEIFVEHSDSDADEISLTDPTDEVAGADENIVKIGGEFDMTALSGTKATAISSGVSTTTTKLATYFPTTAMMSLSSPQPTTTSTLTVTATTGMARIRIPGTAAGKKQFDFKQLALLLQRMIDRRKAKKNTAAKGDQTKHSNRKENELSSERIDQPSVLENTFTVADLKPIELLYRRLNTVQKPDTSNLMSRSLETKREDKVNENESRIKLGGVQALKRSSRHPHEMSISVIASEHENNNSDMAPNSEALIVDSETGNNEDTMIYIIREGSAVQNDENDYEFVSSITLVIDGKNKILVDTGLATDINGRTWMLQRLSELDIAPPSIGFVVTTHGHPDHSGNTNDFPDAHHYAGKFMHHGKHFNFSRIFEDDVEKLTDNVYLLKTPGHTSDDISVLVENTTFFGTVIISGDVFMRKEDMKYPMLWKPLAVNETQQEESRRQLLCLGDHIVPGHGPLFRVTGSVKRKLNCP